MLRCVFLLALCGTSTAAADGSSERWSGSVAVRGNYYWERSTRVIAPEGEIVVTAPSGTRFGVHYLVDSITSASQAAGLNSDIRFTETRHDIELLGGHEIDLGVADLDVSGSARTSREPDYTSYGASLSGALSLNDRATVLSLGIHTTHDRVGEIVRGLTRVGPDGRNLSDRGLSGKLHAVSLASAWAQTLTPTLTAELGYAFGFVDGFQSSPYRVAVVGGVPLDEAHPDRRLRHTLHGRLAYYIRPTHTAVHLLYRAYVDSWDVAALCPEARLYEDLGRWVTLRARYRFYTQTRADFSRKSYPQGTELRSADPKLTEFHSHLAGGQIRVELGFLEGTFLRFADEALIDFSFEYLWNTNRYGNGVISQAGMLLPF